MESNSPEGKRMKKAKAAKPTKAKATAKTKMEVARATEGKVKLAGKKSAKIDIKAVEAIAATANEDEDEDMDLATSSGSTRSSAESMAAAAMPAETATGSLKNFRHHPDIENFYRFIFENDLRYEALEIIDVMISQRATKKTVKVAKSKAH